jgi:hypothetical protein
VTTQSNLTGMARLAGLLSLISLAAGITAEFFIVETVTVPGDIETTIANISSFESLYRLGFILYLVDYAAYAGTTLLLYRVFREAGETLALFALVSSLLGTAIAASLVVHYLAPLMLAGGAADASVGAVQAQEMAVQSLRLRNAGSTVSLFFFGLHLAFIGWLIVESKLVPLVLGLLAGLGGLCFVANSTIYFLAPPIWADLVPLILLPGIAAQALLALWLLAMGVRATRAQLA